MITLLEFLNEAVHCKTLILKWFFMHISVRVKEDLKRTVYSLEIGNYQFDYEMKVLTEFVESYFFKLDSMEWILAFSSVISSVRAITFRFDSILDCSILSMLASYMVRCSIMDCSILSITF